MVAINARISSREQKPKGELECQAQDRAVTEIHAAHRDRLTRFGYGYFETHFTAHGVGLVIHEQPGAATPQEERVEDLPSTSAWPSSTSGAGNGKSASAGSSSPDAPDPANRRLQALLHLLETKRRLVPASVQTCGGKPARIESCLPSMAGDEYAPAILWSSEQSWRRD